MQENQIESIDTELKKLKLPGSNNSTISADDIQQFIQKAFTITSPIDQRVYTERTQIYYVQKSEAPNCAALDKFFRTYQAIAERCHNCYKVQLDVKSLDELLMLHFFMKSLHLKDEIMGKCMVDSRPDQNKYKGLIYCSGVEEAEHVAKDVTLECRKRTTLSPEVSINRGCTPFRKKYPDYGAINTSTTIQEGLRQREEWANKEAKFFKQKNAIPVNKSSSEFSLGELLIFKNWITNEQKSY